MNFKNRHRQPCQQPTYAFTLTEVLVALAIGSLLLAAVVSLSLFGLRSFAALGNYSDLDARSRNALDVMSRDFRQSTGLLSFTNTMAFKSLLFTNALENSTTRITYDSNARTLVFAKSGQPAQTPLTECDAFDFALYQRTPLVTATNLLFYPATNGAGILDPKLCKLITMSWKCSRAIMGAKVNTETVQTAQIILRNKH